jgi:hypothetical protein
MGSLLLYAFVVEGFCQAVGPEVLSDIWKRDRKPAERFPVADKLKLLGERAGVTVDFGLEPWKSIKALLQHRDRLAHPKPHMRLTSSVLDKAPEDVWHEGGKLWNAEWNPLLSDDAVNLMAASVDEALTTIWSGLGRDPDTIWLHGMTMTTGELAQ